MSEICHSSARYGFNTYSLLTMMVLGFNAVANVIANVNKNDNNNNNNINSQDIGSIQGTSQDVEVRNGSLINNCSREPVNLCGRAG